MGDRARAPTDLAGQTVVCGSLAQGAVTGAAGSARVARDADSNQLQLHEKISFVADFFRCLIQRGLHAEVLAPPGLKVYPSPDCHFRARARIGVVGAASEDQCRGQTVMSGAEGKGLFRLVWDAASQSFVVIDNFGLDTLAEPIAAALHVLASLLGKERFSQLRRGLAEVAFQTTLTHAPRQLLTCLIYAGKPDQHKTFDGPLAELRSALEDALALAFAPLQVIAIAKGKKWQWCVPEARDFVHEVLVVDGQALHYRQPFGHFSNPNPHVAAATGQWLRDVAAALLATTDGITRDLLELYCGSGCHTVNLAPLFRRVLAVEVSEKLVQAARYNVASNSLHNVTVLHARSERVCQELVQDRCFELPGTDGAPPERFVFGCVVVDPPRAGLSDCTARAVSNYDHILYVSCNPESMRRDIGALLETHDVCDMALLDHFPYTKHVETAAYLRRRGVHACKNPSCVSPARAVHDDPISATRGLVDMNFQGFGEDEEGLEEGSDPKDHSSQQMGLSNDLLSGVPPQWCRRYVDDDSPGMAVATGTPIAYSIESIGTIRTCFDTKFGIPRQPGLIEETWGIIEFHKPYAQPEMVRGLDGFSHLWLTFVFHDCPTGQWRPTVAPPRLGGRARVGVWATRSTHRPNSLGLSVVRLDRIELEPVVRILVRGADLLDGTPLVDIKPYIKFADSRPDARSGYIDEVPWPTLKVDFSERAVAEFETHAPQKGLTKGIITNVIGLDPRPAYQRDVREKKYDVMLCGLHIRFTVVQDRALIYAITLD